MIVRDAAHARTSSAELDDAVGDEAPDAGCAGSPAPAPCGCGRRCRSASRGRGRTSRRSRRPRRSARSRGGCRRRSSPATRRPRPWRGPASVAGASAGRLALRASWSGRSASGVSRAAAISSGVRRRMKTGLPRNLMVSWLPTSTATDVDLDRGERLHVGRGVHLVDQRPDRRGGGDSPGGAGGDEEKVPAGAECRECSSTWATRCRSLPMPPGAPSRRAAICKRRPGFVSGIRRFDAAGPAALRRTGRARPADARSGALGGRGRRVPAAPRACGARAATTASLAGVSIPCARPSSQHAPLQPGHLERLAGLEVDRASRTSSRRAGRGRGRRCSPPCRRRSSGRRPSPPRGSRPRRARRKASVSGFSRTAPIGLRARQVAPENATSVTNLSQRLCSMSSVAAASSPIARRHDATKAAMTGSPAEAVDGHPVRRRRGRGSRRARGCWR